MKYWKTCKLQNQTKLKSIRKSKKFIKKLEEKWKKNMKTCTISQNLMK